MIRKEVSYRSIRNDFHTHPKTAGLSPFARDLFLQCLGANIVGALQRSVRMMARAGAMSEEDALAGIAQLEQRGICRHFEDLEILWLVECADEQARGAKAWKAARGVVAQLPEQFREAFDCRYRDTLSQDKKTNGGIPHAIPDGVPHQIPHPIPYRIPYADGGQESFDEARDGSQASDNSRDFGSQEERGGAAIPYSIPYPIPYSRDAKPNGVSQETGNRKQEAGGRRQEGPPPQPMPGSLDIAEVFEAINRARRRNGLSALNLAAYSGASGKLAPFYGLADVFPVDTLGAIEREHEAWLRTATEAEIAKGCPVAWWLRAPTEGGLRQKREQKTRRKEEPTGWNPPAGAGDGL